jgi:putative endonuclease
MHYVYAIRSVDHNWIYVGMSDNAINRFHQHNNGEEKITRRYAPFIMIFSMECSNRTEARKYEKFYKSGRGKEFLRRLKYY